MRADCFLTLTLKIFVYHLEKRFKLESTCRQDVQMKKYIHSIQLTVWNWNLFIIFLLLKLWSFMNHKIFVESIIPSFFLEIIRKTLEVSKWTNVCFHWCWKILFLLDSIKSERETYIFLSYINWVQWCRICFFTHL